MTSTKTKSALILLATLIVGMVLGFFLNTIIMKNKFDKFNRMRKPEAMKEMFLEHLNPTEQQKPQLDEILGRFKEKMDILRQNSFDDLGNMKDSLFIELKPILTEKQFEKLNKGMFKRHFGKLYKSGRDGRRDRKKNKQQSAEEN